MLIALLVPLALAILLFGFVLVRDRLSSRKAVPNVEAILLGAIVNFFDTLGHRLVRADDRMVQVPAAGSRSADPPDDADRADAAVDGGSRSIFLILLGRMVDPVLLVGCVLALLMGGLLGVPLVTRARVWIVQLVVAFALMLAAIAYAMTNLHLFPGAAPQPACRRR